MSTTGFRITCKAVPSPVLYRAAMRSKSSLEMSRKRISGVNFPAAKQSPNIPGCGIVMSMSFRLLSFTDRLWLAAQEGENDNLP